MIPDLQFSILCDDVRREDNGKFILIGIFDSLRFRTLPSAPPRICVVNRWCCGSGVFKQVTRIIGPDGVEPIGIGREVDIKLNTQEQTATSVEIFMNLGFKVHGIHWVEILLDDQLRLRYPLIVAPPTGGGQQA
ncbi:MAG: DUF6941 family protein [Kiritimatiellia bacterium]|jgi:hypothetical protein